MRPFISSLYGEKYFSAERERRGAVLSAQWSLKFQRLFSLGHRLLSSQNKPGYVQPKLSLFFFFKSLFWS